MKSSQLGAFSLMIAVLIIISFPSIRTVFQSVSTGEAIAQSSKVLLIAPSDTKKPSKPDDLDADIEGGAIVLDWERSSDNVGVTGYRVYRGMSEKDISFYSLTSKNSFTDVNFERSVRHYYRVSAYDLAGNESSLSKRVSITAPDTLPKSEPKPLELVPPTPYSMTARALSTSSVNLIWKHDYNYQMTPMSYALYRDGVLIATIPFSLGAIGTGTDSYFYRDTGLVPGLTYSYVAKEISNKSVYSASSTPLSVTTISVPDAVFPLVALTAPTPNSTVSGTTTITANASDNVGVAGVQFTLDNVVLGAEDTIAPYSYAWNTRASSNSIHALRAIARDTAGNVTTSLVVNVTVANAGLDPTKKPWQNFNLTTWKLQATAKSGTTDYLLRNISASDGEAVAPWFRTDTTDGSMLFWLNASTTNDGSGWLRTELREVMDGSRNDKNWSALVGTSTLSSRIRIAPGPTYNGAQITILQIHPYPSKPPLLRLVWYPIGLGARQLKAHYKTDALGLADASVLCPNTDIDYNTFDADISIINGRMIVKAGRVGQPMQTCLDYQINAGWTYGNYFKAGNYASQSWMGTAQVHFYKLETYHSEPAIST
ncbi:MAG: polysaccharide lyase family 7 protein [Patescibacteria group bacterium]